MEEGEQLALHTVRFRLKNEIIVAALRDGEGFDAGRWRPRASALLKDLAADAEASAIRMIDERGAAELAARRKEHEHDYRTDDLGNLFRRERVYRGVAARLRSAATAEERLSVLVDGARRQAWEELGEHVVRRATAPAPPTVVGGDRAVALLALAADLEAMRRERE